MQQGELRAELLGKRQRILKSLERRLREINRHQNLFYLQQRGHQLDHIVRRPGLGSIASGAEPWGADLRASRIVSACFRFHNLEPSSPFSSNFAQSQTVGYPRVVLHSAFLAAPE